MNIYKLSQSVNDNYDTYDSCVVIAENEEAARRMHPCENVFWQNGKWQDLKYKISLDNDWAKLDDIKIELIGIAVGVNENGKPSTVTPRVVCASFNAG